MRDMSRRKQDTRMVIKQTQSRKQSLPSAIFGPFVVLPSSDHPHQARRDIYTVQVGGNNTIEPTLDKDI